MMWNASICAVLLLSFAACADPPGFSPAPESYRASAVSIDGVTGERTIARVDSTFFGRNLPMLGRVFISQDYENANPVAILSHHFWMERFDGRPEVIGSTLEVAGVSRTVIGIMPQGVDVPDDVVLWIPGPAPEPGTG
jgi:hypothetical protein